MQVLFEQEKRTGVDPVSALDLNEHELGDVDREFAQKTLQGVIDHHDEICKAIQEHAPGWTLERMDPVSRCVLCVGAYEMLYAKEAPPAVIINEAIDIAKEFGTDEAGKFVNGVLNAMIQK